MVKLMKWIKAAVIAALLNETIKSALISKLVRSVSRSARPSTGTVRGSNQPNHLGTLLEAALALMLLRLKKGSWNMQPMAVSTIAALLASLMEPAARPHEQRNHVIDIDDYKIVDEN
jgi:hypothetical protein